MYNYGIPANHPEFLSLSIKLMLVVTVPSKLLVDGKPVIVAERNPCNIQNEFVYSLGSAIASLFTVIRTCRSLSRV